MILELLNDTSVKNVVLDFGKTDSYGSSALSLFVSLWQEIKGRGGRMAFCNVSCHEQEILQVTHLDHTWPICKSRSEALATVQE